MYNDQVMKQPELGNKILELRQSLGLTQTELAERCNLSLRTIQRIEAQEVTPRSYTIKVIFESLGYSPGQLAEDDAEEANRNNLKRRVEDLFIYVRELFNLKTNTMKKLSVLSVFAVLLFAGSFFVNTTLVAQSKKMKAATESLVGVWQQVVLNPATGEVKYYIPFLKIINPDGTYIHMQMSDKKPAFFNATGKWKLKSDNVFLEHVELMYGTGLRNHTEQQTFSIEKTPNGTFMNSHFHTVGKDMADVHETWKKCDFSEWNFDKKTPANIRQ